MMLGSDTGCVVVVVLATEEPCDVDAPVPINGFGGVGGGIGVRKEVGVGVGGVIGVPEPKKVPERSERLGKVALVTSTVMMPGVPGV